MSDRITPPSPPEKNLEVFKAQLEYYHQLKEYHRQQMVLAQEKFARLKAFLELELSTPEIEVAEESLPEAGRSTGVNGVKLVENTTKTKILSDVATNNNSVQTKIIDRDDERNISGEDSDLISSEVIVSENNNSYTVINSLEDPGLQTIETKNVSSEISGKEVENFPRDNLTFKFDSKLEAATDFSSQQLLDESDRLELQINREVEIGDRYPPSTILSANNQNLRNAIRAALETTQRPMTTKEVYSFIYPSGLSKLEENKMRPVIGKALCDGLDEKLWVRVDRGIYATNSIEITASATRKDFATNNSSKAREDLAVEEERGAGKLSSTTISGTLSQDKVVERPNGDRDNNLSIDSVNKVDDRESSPIDVKNTPLYELIDRALRSAAPNTMNVDDIVNWIYPQSVSGKIWKKTRKSVASALSNHLSKNLWKRVSQGYYRTLASPIQKDLVEKKHDNIKNQTVLTLNSISNSPNSKNNLDERFGELTPNLKTLFEAEARGEILHHNYVANKIFGQNYQKHLPELLEILALGQKQKLWARVPEDPDCWTTDLSLLPTEEIEFVEEEEQ